MSPASSNPSKAKTKQIPRLRIHHLLLWMVCSAVYLTTAEKWTSSFDARDEIQTARVIYGMFSGIVNGAALSGSIILFHTFFRSLGFNFRHPGHWFLPAITAQSLPWFAFWILKSLGFAVSEIANSLPLFDCVFLCLPIGCYIFGTLRVVERRWKAFFIAMLLAMALKLLANLFLLFDTLGFSLFSAVDGFSKLAELALIVWLCAVATLDKRSYVPRDWLHWLGIAVMITSLATPLVWTIVLVVVF